ncbi:hypothetical protein PV356_36795, partial [Streptomyces sp. WI03-5b]|uniref:hypothetical protein n=1 Tax=Streptomyces sp. WI03-5b TaxID=462946 RepID=UPI0029B9D40B
MTAAGAPAATAAAAAGPVPTGGLRPAAVTGRDEPTSGATGRDRDTGGTSVDVSGASAGPRDLSLITIPDPSEQSAISYPVLCLKKQNEQTKVAGKKKSTTKYKQ